MLGIDVDKVAEPFVEKMDELIGRLDRVITLLEEVVENTED